MTIQDKLLDEQGSPPPPLLVALFFSKDALEKITLHEHSHFAIKQNGKSSLPKKLENWFLSYFSNRSSPFPLPLDFSRFSPFAIAVLEEMQKIPFGKVCTYGEIAKKVGQPGAARAVGKICNINPYPLVIPCHRVVAKGGRGGFAYGNAMKDQLLQCESVMSLV